MKLAGAGAAGAMAAIAPMAEKTHAQVRNGSNSAAAFDVRTFGAKGDGASIDTPAINRAIEAAAAAGGGTVRFPAGNYLCYSIHLHSNVALFLDQGAVIVAADPLPEGQPGGYDDPEPRQPWEAYQDFGHNHWHNSLIWGGARVVITGNPNHGPKKFGEYFDTSVFQRPSTSVYDTATGQVIPTDGYSSLEATTIYPPSHWDFQTALFKDFKIHERLAVQLRLETYNTFNNPEFDSVDPAAKFSAFSGGTSVPTLNGNVMTNGTTTRVNSTFGQINHSAGPRTLQLAARIQF